MKVLAVTDLTFPYGSAMSSRIKSFCTLFKELGYEPHIIAGKTDDKNIEFGKEYIDSSFSYEIVKTNRSEKIQSFIGNENLLKRVDEYLNQTKVAFVFFNSLGDLFNEMIKICKKHKVKTILEQCEWYDASGFRFNKVDYRYIRFNKNIKNNYKKANGIISISRLLNDYYLSIGANSIKIPSIFDVENNKCNLLLNNSKIKLIYAGSTGKSKELLAPIFKSLSLSRYSNIELNIYGMSKEKIQDNIDCKIPDNVIVHGRVPYEELEDALLNSNYQIFIKPKRKSSNAQFPTKLAESMAFGTPVIANNTGDISLYLKDGENGFICDENNLNATFDRILDISDNDYNLLRKAARETALDYFDYRRYKDDVAKLIESL